MATNLPMPAYYVRLEKRRLATARKLIRAHHGNLTAAADDAWERMETAHRGSVANRWGEVVNIIHAIEDESRKLSSLTQDTP